jgi:hypothetical protein
LLSDDGHQVGLAVAVDVADCEGSGLSGSDDRLARREAARPVSPPQPDRGGVTVCCGEIRFPVTGEVGGDERDARVVFARSAHGQLRRRSKASRTVAEEDPEAIAVPENRDDKVFLAVAVEIRVSEPDRLAARGDRAAAREAPGAVAQQSLHEVGPARRDRDIGAPVAVEVSARQPARVRAHFEWRPVLPEAAGTVAEHDPDVGPVTVVPHRSVELAVAVQIDDSGRHRCGPCRRRRSGRKRKVIVARARSTCDERSQAQGRRPQRPPPCLSYPRVPAA